jgi:hypothetical protein
MSVIPSLPVKVRGEEHYLITPNTRGFGQQLVIFRWGFTKEFPF